MFLRVLLVVVHVLWFNWSKLNELRAGVNVLRRRATRDAHKCAVYVDKIFICCWWCGNVAHTHTHSTPFRMNENYNWSFESIHLWSPLTARIWTFFVFGFIICARRRDHIDTVGVTQNIDNISAARLFLLSLRSPPLNQRLRDLYWVQVYIMYAGHFALLNNESKCWCWRKSSKYFFRFFFLLTLIYLNDLLVEQNDYRRLDHTRYGELPAFVWEDINWRTYKREIHAK